MQVIRIVDFKALLFVKLLEALAFYAVRDGEDISSAPASQLIELFNTLFRLFRFSLISKWIVLYRILTDKVLVEALVALSPRNRSERRSVLPERL